MKLSLREKSAYGIGAIGKDMVYMLVTVYIMKYYNTVLGVDSVYVGFALMVTRVLDALNDPLMGIIVQNTRTKWGKFRPWIFSGTLINAAFIIALFSVPQQVTGTGLKAYLLIVYILWGFTYTLMDIPFWSMLPSLTGSGKDRENLSVIGRTCAGLGGALAVGLTPMVINFPGVKNQREGYSLMAVFVTVVFVATLMFMVTNVKERVVVKEDPIRFRDIFRTMKRNDQAIAVVIMIVLFNTSLYLTNTLSQYYFDYDIGNETLFSVFGILGGGVQILSMMTFPVFRSKMSLKKILIMAIGVAATGYLALFGLGISENRNISLVFLAGIIIFFGFGLVTVLTTVFLADTVDYGEYKYQERTESVIFSMQTFVVQLSSGFSAFLAGIVLKIINLNVIDPEKGQELSSLMGLRIAMTLIPLTGICVAVMFFMKMYKLNDEYMSKINTKLKERQEQ